MGPRGAATWPGVPRRIQVGPARNLNPFFYFLFFILNSLKSKIKSEKSGKIPENYKIHNFQNITPN